MAVPSSYQLWGRSSENCCKFLLTHVMLCFWKYKLKKKFKQMSKTLVTNTKNKAFILHLILDFSWKLIYIKLRWLKKWAIKPENFKDFVLLFYYRSQVRIFSLLKSWSYFSLNMFLVSSVSRQNGNLIFICTYLAYPLAYQWLSHEQSYFVYVF